MSDELKHWQKQRIDELSAPESWLGLVGLYWLQPGLNRVGGAADAVVVLPDAPDYMGDLRWADGVVEWLPVKGAAQLLQTDLRGAPSIVDHGDLSFFVVDREGQLAVRVRDRAWARKIPFAGLDYFEFAPEWQIEAEWQAIDPPMLMEVPNVSGDLKAVSVAHRAVFSVAGETASLLPMAAGPDEVFFVFRDRTSGKESYGAGRFLKTAAPREGRVLLDFNRAYNPPCAFTPFATCPLPPPENWLPFPVLAGEKKWQKTE